MQNFRKLPPINHFGIRDNGTIRLRGIKCGHPQAHVLYPLFRHRASTSQGVANGFHMQVKA